MQLRCPNEVGGDIWIWSTRRGLKRKFYWTTQTMVTKGILPFKEKSPRYNWESNPGPHDQKLWPLDHEARQWSVQIINLVFAELKY
jgi:hypothetical protein